MKDGFGMEVIRLEVANGRVKMGEWPVDAAPSSSPSNWGSLYAVCHAIDQQGRAERLCNRVEEIAQETYRRSLGGATNRLRQALRNANRYLYLRNRARGDRQTFLAAMSCVAIRGTDAYASGAGSYAAFLISGGRVHDFLNPVPSSGVGPSEDWPDDGNLLGQRAVLSEPRFSYRQALPSDLVLLIAADDVEVFEYIGDILPLMALEEETKGAAQHIVRLGRRFSDFSALLVHVGSATTALQEDKGASDFGTAERVESPDQVSLLPRLGLKSRGARKHGGHTRRESKTLSKGALTSKRDEPPASPCPTPPSAVGYGRKVTDTRRSWKRPGGQFLQQGAEMCRVAAALMLSLIYGLFRAGLALFRSVGKLVRGVRSWIRQHRVFEKVGRGCELALLAFWAGSKGLIIRILPERRSPMTTNGYSASAGPMARAKVVGFNPSRRSRLMIGALIVSGIFLVLTASGVRIKSRLVEEADREALMTKLEETLLLAEAESDNEARIGLLLQAREMIDEATGIQVDDNADLSELSKRLERQWDAASGVVRIPFDVDQTLTIGEGAPRRMLIHEDQLYILDGAGQGLYRYMLDQEGRLITNQDPRILELQGEANSVPADSVVDMEGIDAANGRLTPALLMLTGEGSLLELNSAGVARNVTITDVLRWESARAIRTYHGSLYVLDPGRENIIKYIPTGDNYEYPPVNYFQESEDIRWAKVADMAIDGSVYLLLSNGSIMKFTSGEPDTFTQEGVYPPLEHPTAIFTSTDSASVFVAEPGQERIVELSTAGQFIRQFRAVNGGEDPVADLGSFVVDLQHGQVFIGTAAGLYSAPLPSPR
jgi:hypothetical protein